jgi:hypothetical protein
MQTSNRFRHHIVFEDKLRTDRHTDAFEDEDCHMRIYPPAAATEQDVADIEGKLADRCVDILLEKGIFICSAVYD